ncbi:zinc finger protein OZF-like [Anoplopoma fimbria]|uniref:zinc finger protein OZF-like n=1 Tax=Anoplopoma fimbria TaxID=229290 RepID=UPI0023EB8C47|nr:zinc finger protein OZF-like [Anoplopoma fimbria]
MSSVESLREFVTERLTAAAQEIFGVFEKTIFQYEEEVDRQRRLLDVVWKPAIKLHRIELPKQHVCEEEEVLSDQQLCVQERNSSLDQEDPEPPQVKEEQEEPCTSQEGEQLELKQETETFVLTPSYEESDHGKDQTLNMSNDENQSMVEETPLGYTSVESSVVPEPNEDHQLLSHNSHADKSQDQKGGEHGSSESTSNAEPKPLLQCDTCGKEFKFKSSFYRHLRTHTGEKPHSCNVCGKRFSQKATLKPHMKIHTGENMKPHSCKTCEKTFPSNSQLLVHMRKHTGEKPYSCNVCGKGFSVKSSLTFHMKIHTEENFKPHSCKTCGKDFRHSGNLVVHMRTHTGEKPYSCETCGKDFRHSSVLLVHTRRAHKGEKPFICKTCGNRYLAAFQLARHVRWHTDK